ncbi:hypothetical protein GCM10027063_13660 [Promicromonospora xylanilytica]
MPGVSFWPMGAGSVLTPAGYGLVRLVDVAACTVTPMPGRRLLPAALAFVTLIVLAGCSPAYQSADFTGTFTDTDGGTLTLDADGTYELSGIPLEMLDGRDGAGSTEQPDFAGTWELLLPEASSDVIMLYVDEGGGSFPSGNVQIWVDSADRLYVFPNGVDSGPLHYLDRASTAPRPRESGLGSRRPASPPEASVPGRASSVRGQPAADTVQDAAGRDPVQARVDHQEPVDRTERTREGRVGVRLEAGACAFGRQPEGEGVDREAVDAVEHEAVRRVRRRDPEPGDHRARGERTRA